jgi:hypothetical protein
VTLLKLSKSFLSPSLLVILIIVLKENGLQAREAL